jgi:hypothetical protein
LLLRKHNTRRSGNTRYPQDIIRMRCAEIAANENLGWGKGDAKAM